MLHVLYPAAVLLLGMVITPTARGRSHHRHTPHSKKAQNTQKKHTHTLSLRPRVEKHVLDLLASYINHRLPPPLSPSSLLCPSQPAAREEHDLTHHSRASSSPRVRSRSRSGSGQGVEGETVSPPRSPAAAATQQGVGIDRWPTRLFRIFLPPQRLPGLFSCISRAFQIL